MATITLFGTLAVLVYPLFGHALGMTDTLFGHWAGIAVNDTSQVTATGFAFSEAAGQTATIVKLTRNTLMAPLLMLIGIWYTHWTTAETTMSMRKGIWKAVPLFVLGFLAMALLNSIGAIPDAINSALSELSKALILIALVAVGLSTDLGSLRNVGITPFVLGLSVATLLALLSLGILILMSPA